MKIEIVRKYHIPASVFRKFKETQGWGYDNEARLTDNYAEFVEWCSDNLSKSAEPTMLFDGWVVNTTDDDDIVLLTLAFGQARNSYYDD